jgi:SAM-dependent methyltransferase
VGIFSMDVYPIRNPQERAIGNRAMWRAVRWRMTTNLELNRDFHDRIYRQTDPAAVVQDLRDSLRFLESQCTTYSHWKGCYWDDFARKLKGSRVLELGAGTGHNALLMAQLGAHVTTIDIAEHSEALIHAAAKLLDLKARVHAITGDVCTCEFPPRSFEFVVGKGFLHHLTHEQEDLCLRKVARWLIVEARFFENAENNAFIDKLRWYLPMHDRPSCLCKKAFAAHKQINPTHPPRDNGWLHYEAVGERYFDYVKIVPFGGLERFHRVFRPESALELSFRRSALRLEDNLPYRCHLRIARCQTLVLREPKNPVAPSPPTPSV